MELLISAPCSSGAVLLVGEVTMGFLLAALAAIIAEKSIFGGSPGNFWAPDTAAGDEG